MKKTLKSAKKYLILINEGNSLKDRVAIASYCIYFLLNLLSNRKSHKLFLNVTLRNSHGIFYCGNNILSVWTGSSFHEPELRKYLNLKEGVAVDVGANIGMHTIPLARRLKNKGQVISIEPEKENFNILNKNIKLNELNNVISLNKGCFSKKGKLTFYLDNIGTGGHSLVKKDVGNKKIEIEVDTLDNILKNLKINRVDLIKIDVEGAEADVLKGAEKTLKKHHPKIIFEALNDGYFKNCKKILDEYAYKIKRIDEINYYAY